ncbi:hypothetical protein SAMN04489729_4053 [Amycolatopsis lurida]|uniref:Uncharacterized protein n=1 Tax=Amycolatopsis lurida NRRL 2430 TaxID=1460371 RepID=A0A2P2G2B0_AMYLU|nr:MULTISPECIES: hypothetical protein [Amycolatopsis]KFU83103.1 hypothetical protein BB31_01015 [Amycolatopsis lurida NRRL 2430]QXV59946.1 hypothetical protein CVV72_25005 [Amycolatopsis sp. TNS106]SED33039.1 hypothetical protein SAMN04489729_4053 [Amycolatopsis lurida]
MAEYDYDSTQTQSSQPAKRGVDAITLFVGIATLLVSAYVLSDGASWLPQFDFRWVMAGGAIFVGVLLLAASLRKSRR